jgi:hypothetical protein
MADTLAPYVCPDPRCPEASATIDEYADHRFDLHGVIAEDAVKEAEAMDAARAATAKALTPPKADAPAPVAPAATPAPPRVRIAGKAVPVAEASAIAREVGTPDARTPDRARRPRRATSATPSTSPPTKEAPPMAVPCGNCKKTGHGMKDCPQASGPVCTRCRRPASMGHSPACAAGKRATTPARAETARNGRRPAAPAAPSRCGYCKHTDGTHSPKCPRRGAARPPSAASSPAGRNGHPAAPGVVPGLREAREACQAWAAKWTAADQALAEIEAMAGSQGALPPASR